jgi:hypothetical protein
MTWKIVNKGLLITRNQFTSGNKGLKGVCGIF